MYLSHVEDCRIKETYKHISCTGKVSIYKNVRCLNILPWSFLQKLARNVGVAQFGLQMVSGNLVTTFACARSVEV